MSKKQYSEFSKKLVDDTRLLLFFVTFGGLLLAFYCVHQAYTGALAWIAGMESAAWAAHGTICSFYMNMAKSDHKGANGDGITYATAMRSQTTDSQDDLFVSGI